MTDSVARETLRGAIAVQAALLGAAVLLGACTPEAPETAEVVRPVKIFEVGSPEEGRVREYPAFVRAARSAEIGFEVPGRVVRIDAKQGQQVQPGDVLAVLDDRDYTAQLEIELANLRKAQADLDRSQAVYAQDPGAITLQRIDGDRRAVEVAQARVTQARKSVEDTVLKAPFAGVVSRRLVELYENVQAKQPVLIVENLGDIQVEVNVPERDLGTRATAIAGYSPDQLEQLTQRFAPTVEVSAIGGMAYPGRIVEIATRADAATRTFALRIAFQPPEGVVILPGMTARVKVNLDSTAAISVPLSALVATPGAEPQVWVIDPETMTAHGRVIRLGEMGEGTVEVLAGLMPGDWIATTGAQQLAEGMRVSRYESAH